MNNSKVINKILKCSLICSFVCFPGNVVNTRILKCMIPTTLISEDSVVKAVSWLCVGKCSGSTKVIFLNTLMISPSEPLKGWQGRATYGVMAVAFCGKPVVLEQYNLMQGLCSSRNFLLRYKIYYPTLC